MASWINSNASSIYLKTDRHAQFYYQGTLIPFPTILKLFETSTRTTKAIAADKEDKSEEQRWLGVEFPIGLGRNSDALKTQLDTLFKIAKKLGWKTPDEQEPISRDD